MKILLLYPVCALVLTMTAMAIFLSMDLQSALLIATGFGMISAAQIVGLSKAYILNKNSDQESEAVLPTIPYLQYLSHVGIVVATAGFVFLLFELNGL